jgi:hypothetical protein
MAEQDSSVMTTQQASASMRQAEATTRGVALVLLALGCIAAYWVWPAGITDTPLGTIRFGTLLQALLSAAIALIALCVAALIGIDWD